MASDFVSFVQPHADRALSGRHGKWFMDILLLTLLLFLFSGCSDREDSSSAKIVTQQAEIRVEQKNSEPLPAIVTIPESISSAWVSVRIEVAFLGSGKRKTLEIGLGKDEEIAGTNLRVKALSFLPAFQMDGHEITSRSNELENPAAQIEVYEGDRQIFKGWLFSLYPTTHAFTHPRYSLSLIEGVAVDKNK